MKFIASGIFTWCFNERRSNRYGVVAVDCINYDRSAEAETSSNHETFRELLGKRVRLIARIDAARKSGHAGDAGLKVAPPAVPLVPGTLLEIGVGILDTSWIDWADMEHGIMLRPNDGRAELWMDPRILYQLHDQTVTIFAEETDDDFTPAPDISCENGAFDNGDETFQVKKIDKIPFKTESISAGISILEPDMKRSPFANSKSN